ncbi:MAG: ATP-dependent RecD-like DNA helicase [Oscillospiraceae bacterium]|nr:ATP-dependent RecD-like DNA helicase [Oscillospiraceae bacterium]
MNQTEKIEGTIQYITFTSPDTGFTVLELETADDEITVVGEMVGVAPGQQMVAEGTFTNHPSFGRQFKAQSYEITLPEDLSAILMYLASGAVKGIGPVTAKKIVKAFKEETFEVLESDPVRLSQVNGISYKQALAIQEEFLRIYGIQDAIVHLAHYGLTARQAISLYGTYGANTVEIMHSDPYIICNAPTMLPFEQADDIANKMMFEYDNSRRIAGGIMYVLNHNSQKGHTCVPFDKLVETVSAFITVEPEKIESGIRQECEKGNLFTEIIDDREFVYLSNLYVAEIVSAQKLSLLTREKPEEKNVDEIINKVEKMLGIEYAQNQKKALEKVANNKVCIITGGPGTGKTTLVKGIISMFEMQAQTVSLCAPTGRAAKRLTELSGKEAKTIHRLLEVVPGSKKELKFQHGPENPINCEVLIVDEFSMVDILLFSRLISAVKEDCRVIFVGDYNQLPAVGPGNILKDMLDSGLIPAVELTDIFRQARESDIVLNAHAINRGEMPKISGKTGDYFFIPGGDNINDLVSGLAAQRLPKAYGVNPFEDIQILTPSRKRNGGTGNINRVMQAVLNPPAEDKPQIVFNGITFRLGDKVMQVRNNYDLEYTRDNGETDMGVFNGDIGKIVSVDKRNKVLKIKFDDKTYAYTAEFFNQIEHAWAITVHKSQGSEFNTVILCLNDTPKELQYRNLLYTAFTRAKKLLVVVGKYEILEQMVKNDRKHLRYSGIKHFLQEYNG